MQDLIQREKRPLIESCTVGLPSVGLTAQSEVDMELQGEDPDWEPKTMRGVQVFSLHQVRGAGGSGAEGGMETRGEELVRIPAACLHGRRWVGRVVPAVGQNLGRGKGVLLHCAMCKTM